ncbi:MAG: Tfp pilus assembly protein PilF [Cognaticolwellia sp.]|jgi:Tfp pilus assembly protein PilF
MACGKHGLGLEALEQSLLLAPQDGQVRARFASHLFDDQRYAQAREQALIVLSSGDSTARKVGLGVAGAYARRLMRQRDDAAVAHLLAELGEWVLRDATLSAVRAWMLDAQGERREAQDALRAAHKLEPKHPLILALQEPLGIKRWSWFGW